jgi:hypothetical protein
MRANRVMDVIAVTTAQGDYYMTTSTIEDRTSEDRTAHVTGAERAKPSKWMGSRSLPPKETTT